MTDEFIFENDIQLTSVSFFVAKRPGSRLEIEWFRFSIDGTDVQNIQTGKLPSDQGIWASLGWFEEGRQLQLKWSFRTGIDVPDGQKVLLGYFPNGRLTDATRLKTIYLERFTEYNDDTIILVP